MRFKKRYLVCEIIYDGGDLLSTAPLTRGELYRCVKDAVQKAHGDYGSAVLQMQLTVKYFSPETNIVMFRADRAWYKWLMSAMTFVKSISRYNACFHTLHIGGTIRSCYKFLIKYHRQQLPKLLSRCSTEEEKNKIKEIIRRSDNPDTFSLAQRSGISSAAV